MSSPVLSLPASYKFGRVVCRVLQGVSDSPFDVDHFPEARPAAGTITFTPNIPVVRDFGNSPAIVGHGAYTYSLHAESGELVDDSTRDTPSVLVDLGEGEIARLVPGAGVWLFEGLWTVKFSLGPISVPSFPILVSAIDHTATTPMDLVAEMTYVAVPGEPTSLVDLPLGRVPGRVLGISDAGQVAWIPQTGQGGSGNWNTIIGKPNVVASGSTVSDARLSIGAVSDSDPRLSDARNPTAHTHLIANVTGLQAAIDGKQPSGNYALSSDVRLTDARTPTAHTHAWADVTTGKPTTFPPIIGSTATTAVAGDDFRLTNARTPTTHSHPVTEVSGLQAVLDGKQASGSYALTTDPRFTDARPPTAHTHTVANVTGLQAAIDGKQASGSYASGAQGAKADTAVQPAGLTKAAVGLGSVDNTSDMAKPVSIAQGTALSGKANAGPGVPGVFWGFRTAAEWATLPAPTGTGPWWGIAP